MDLSRPDLWIVASGLFGFLSGLVLPLLVARWSVEESEAAPHPVETIVRLGLPVLLAAGYAAFAWGVLSQGLQSIPEAQFSFADRVGRLWYHLVLFDLLLICFGTDVRSYLIPDAATVSGMIIGVAFATAWGEAQLVHVWVDWNQEVPGLRGPGIPEWCAASHHLHGFVWSVAGLLVGGGVVWLVRLLTLLVGGREGIGFGDVTLMACAGAFLGWQPVLIALCLAPLIGVLILVGSLFVLRKSYLPFGPPLIIASMAVVAFWSPIWMLEVPLSGSHSFKLRHLLGDAAGLAALAGIAVGVLILLLGLLRAYRAIPVRSRIPQSPEAPEAPLSEPPNMSPDETIPEEPTVRDTPTDPDASTSEQV